MATALPVPASNPAPQPKPRRWSIIAAGFLLLALAFVVLYTNRTAFSSPLAMVVVGAIGLAALLLQIRLRRDGNIGVHVPLWLNVLAIVFAGAALLADTLHLSAHSMQIAALGAVICFGISGIIVLRGLRKRKS